MISSLVEEFLQSKSSVKVETCLLLDINNLTGNQKHKNIN